MSGAAPDAQPRPAREVLPEIHHVHSRLGFGDGLGRQFQLSPHRLRRVSSLDEALLGPRGSATTGYQPVSTNGERPSRFAQAGRHRPSRCKCRLAEWARRTPSKWDRCGTYWLPSSEPPPTGRRTGIPSPNTLAKFAPSYPQFVATKPTIGQHHTQGVASRPQGLRCRCWLSRWLFILRPTRLKARWS